MNKFIIYAEADHPVTCLNPDRYFRVIYWKAEGGKLYVRGKKGMWFNSSLCKFYTEEQATEMIKEIQS